MEERSDFLFIADISMKKTSGKAFEQNAFGNCSRGIHVDVVKYHVNTGVGQRLSNSSSYSTASACNQCDLSREIEYRNRGHVCFLLALRTALTHSRTTALFLFIKQMGLHAISPIGNLEQRGHGGDKAFARNIEQQLSGFYAE